MDTYRSCVIVYHFLIYTAIAFNRFQSVKSTFHSFVFIDLNESNNSEADESTTQVGFESCTGPRKKVNFFLSAKKSANAELNNGKYALSFHSETTKEMKAQKEAAKEPIQFLSPNDLETGDEYFQGYDFPIRPRWTHGMSKEAMNGNENRYFTVE